MQANRRSRQSTVSQALSRLKPYVMVIIGVAYMCCWGVQPVSGDTLKLRDGNSVQGQFVSSDGKTLTFNTGLGVQSVLREQVVSLTFSAPPAPVVAPVAVAAPAATATVAPAASGPVTIPAGTVLLVTTTSPVSSTDKAGGRFSAKLAQDLTTGSVVVAPAGATVYGRITKSSQAGRMAGKSTLELALSEVSINGKMYPLMTSNYAEAGKGSFRKTARNAGVGALVGGAFGDSDDAKKGAAIGLGVSALRKGQAVGVPAGSLLEFRMTQPLAVMP